MIIFAPSHVFSILFALHFSNKIIAKGYSSYNEDCVEAVIKNAGINATPLREWVVSWPADRKLREDLAESTLYLTLEPSPERKG